MSLGIGTLLGMGEGGTKPAASKEPSLVDLDYVAEQYSKKVFEHLPPDFYHGIDHQFHLMRVHQVAKEFMELIPGEYRMQLLAAAWVHDIFEVTDVTYKQVRKELGAIVAELAFAVSKERKSRTSTERYSESYFRGIKLTPFATYLALCDRIADFTFLNAVWDPEYYRELYHSHNNFNRHCLDTRYEPMFKILREKMLKPEQVARRFTL